MTMKTFRERHLGACLYSMLAASALLTIILQGCATRLETGGAYAPAPITNEVTGVVTASPAPDPGLFAVDTTADFLFTTIQAVFKLERDNRNLFWKISPNIKHTLDGIRPQAKQAVEDFGKARTVYLANPTPAGLSTLDTILGQLKAFSSAVQAVIPSAAQVAAATTIPNAPNPDPVIRNP